MSLGALFQLQARPRKTGGIEGGLPFAHAFSQASYSKQNERPAVIEGYHYDPTTSNKRTAIYYNANSNKLVVAFRGTDFSDPYDVWEDVRIATGTFAGASRIKKGKEIVKAAAKKYDIPVRDVQLTGHSLGGRITQAVGQKLHSESLTALNPGSSPIDILHPSAGTGFGQVFTTSVDPVSISGTIAQPANVNFRAPQTIEPHGLRAFGVQPGVLVQERVERP